jgi:hypothetical protein
LRTISALRCWRLADEEVIGGETAEAEEEEEVDGEGEEDVEVDILAGRYAGRVRGEWLSKEVQV